MGRGKITGEDGKRKSSRKTRSRTNKDEGKREDI
jgi:hypothetical protein